MIIGAIGPQGNALDRPARPIITRRDRHEDGTETVVQRRAAFESHMPQQNRWAHAPATLVAPGSVLQLSAAAAQSTTVPSHAVKHYLPEVAPRRLGGRGLAV